MVAHPSAAPAVVVPGAVVAKRFSAADFDAIMAQQQQKMKAPMDKIDTELPRTGVVTIAEAGVLVACGYSVRIWAQFNEAVQTVENMLMEQLVAAIGKRITPADFSK